MLQQDLPLWSDPLWPHLLQGRFLEPTPTGRAPGLCCHIYNRWTHLIFGQGLAFAILVLNTTSDPEGSDVGLDPAKIGRCWTSRVGHRAVQAVGAGQADIGERLKGEQGPLWPKQLLLLSFQDSSRCKGGDAHPVPQEEDHILGSPLPVLVPHLPCKHKMRWCWKADWVGL